jgi:hypothetical protein
MDIKSTIKSFEDNSMNSLQISIELGLKNDSFSSYNITTSNWS